LRQVDRENSLPFPKKLCDPERGNQASCYPNFLIPETVIREAGTGPELSVSSAERGLLLLTLGITRIIEQQELGHRSLWLGRQRRVERKAAALLSAKVLLRHLSAFARLEPAPGNEISTCEMASQPLGPGRPEAAVRRLPVRAGREQTGRRHR